MEKALEQGEIEQPVYTRREIAITMIGLLLILFVGTLDQTIVNTALPRIIGDLQGFDLVTWVTTVYMVTSTVTIPIYGKLSDLFGRKAILLFGIVVFLIGSALSGIAQTMTQLILFRAFQGLGAGALIPISSAVVGDLFPPRERGKWMGVTSSAYGSAAIAGPILGGWLTDQASWRWVFFVNLPIGIIVLGLLFFIMPALKSTAQQGRIDYLGTLLLIACTVPFLLGFSWAGSQYAWLSPQILALFGGALLFLVLFVLYEAALERQGREPIIEPGLFRKSVRILGVGSLAVTLFGICTYGGTFFVPFFFQGVIGTTVTNSGLLLIPFMITSIAGAVISGALMTISGKYKWIALTGIFITLSGLCLLLRLDVHSSSTDVVLSLLVLGLGVGSGLGTYTTAIQNALPRKIGQVTAIANFARQIGGAIGLAAMGSIMSAAYLPAFRGALPGSLQQSVPANILSVFENPGNLVGGEALARIQASLTAQGPQGLALFQQLREAMKVGLTQGMHNVFLVSLGIMLVTLLIVLFLQELPLRSRKSAQGPTATVETQQTTSSVAP